MTIDPTRIAIEADTLDLIDRTAIVRSPPMRA
jgi:hypothetical protein